MLTSVAEAGAGFGQPISADRLTELDATGWELYHVAEDPSETRNVAAEHRDRLIALIATWYVEAGMYDVMPIDGSGLARLIAEKPVVSLPRDRFVYRPNTRPHDVHNYVGRAWHTVSLADVVPTGSHRSGSPARSRPSPATSVANSSTTRRPNSVGTWLASDAPARAVTRRPSEHRCDRPLAIHLGIFWEVPR